MPLRSSKGLENWLAKNPDGPTVFERLGHKIISGVNGDDGDLVVKSHVNVRESAFRGLGHRVKHVNKIGLKFKKVPVLKRLGPKMITEVQGKKVGF